MPFIRDGDKPRAPGSMPVPPVTEVRPVFVPGTRVNEAGHETHQWVMVRVVKGHRFTPSIGPEAFYGPGRHYVRHDIAREIESAECRAAAEEHAFRDPTPVARILNGFGRAARVSPDELDSFLGRA